MKKLLKLLFFVFFIVIAVWFVGFLRVPRLDVKLVEIMVAEPDSYWELTNTKNMKQAEFVFEISNTYHKKISIINVVSSKLNRISEKVRNFNYIYPHSIPAGKTTRLSIYYLMDDLEFLKDINIEKDFKVYASFKGILSETLEPTWRSNLLFSSLFGIGISKVKDYREE